MKRYERLAAELRRRIETGLYDDGQRLPSIRSLSRDHSVSISTVLEAYRTLEDEGLATPRPKSGYFVRHRGAPSRVLEISLPEQRPVDVAQWDDVVSLLSDIGTGEYSAISSASPDTTSPALRRLLGGNRAARVSTDMAVLQRGPLAGDPGLRSQIARLALDAGCSLTQDEIIVTTGCQEALACCVRALAREGDVVALDSPSFYGAIQTIRASGLKVIEIPTHPDTGISLEALELALEQWPIKVLQVTPTCNNPVGYTMPDVNKQRLISLANRFDLTIIEDDIYGDLAFGYPRPRALKAFDRDGRVLLCSGFSKTLAPGLRVGWVAPGRNYDRVAHLKYVSSGATPMAAQRAVASFVADGEYTRHVRKMRGLYRARRDAMIDLVRREFPDNVRHSCPHGGYLLWVELPEAIDCMLLNRRLAASDIKIAPGALFSASGKYRNCLRLNYATGLNSQVVEAVSAIGREIHTMLRETLGR